ncbi:MAG: 50S ribosomal protein L11 methyltransferase [Actinomycetota bacterium]|nr:50S ribosomal protein L11 methyltransferase [Actinomycetota bacterium]
MLRLAVRVQREHAELVLAELLELAPSGVEEVPLEESVIEYAIYGAPGELPSLPDVTAAAAGALIEVRTTELEDGWAERWRQFHKPVEIGDALTVRPPWEPPGCTSIDLVIDPGQAFGTGAHPTTRLCLELMLEVPARGPFLDLGCGSGVLAIAAAKLGWAPVLALDNDPACLEASARNARRNRVQLQIRRHDLRCHPVPMAGTAVANLLRPLLLEYAMGLGHARPERLIASGLLRHECDEVSGAFAPSGLVEAQRVRSGDWAAILLISEGYG